MPETKNLTVGDNQMKLLPTVLSAAVAAAVFAAPAFAQESATLKKIKDTGSITLGHRESSIPFSYYDDKQQVIGYAHEVLLKGRGCHQG
jgi:glutamate/aspartate transport system substrate-binding protein